MSRTPRLRAALYRNVAALTMLVAALASQPATARTDFPKIRIAPEATRSEDPGLAALLDRLRELVAAKDLAGVRRQVADGFRWDRDFGGGYAPEAGAAENFVTALQLDDSRLAEEYRGIGWRRLGEMLEARSMGAGGEADEICAPGEPRFRSPTDQARADAIDGFYFDFGYVEATGVAVRAAPRLDAMVLDRVSEEVVRVSDWAPELEAGKGWIEVETARGASGHMATRFVESFLADRICFGPDAHGAWAITAYVGGGD